MQSKWQEITFSDSDVVNPEEFIPSGSYNPHNVRGFLLHDHGFVVCVVFAQNLQDALDEACDAGKLNRYAIDAQDHDEYGVNTEKPTCTFLGNACEPFDIESLEAVELPNPPFSFCALFNAQK